MSKFFMMVGISGSGKSYIAKKLSQKFNAKIISTDNLRSVVLGDVSSQSNNKYIYNLAFENVINELKQNQNVILDATNLISENRVRILSLLPKDCEKIAYIVKCDLNTAICRVQKDINEMKNRSNTPIAVIIEQSAQFDNDIEKIINEFQYNKILIDFNY